METKKLYIKSLQKLSFKAFAILAYVLLFISQRFHFLNITELELNDVSDSFGLSGIAFGKASKFFDYFGVEFPPELQICMYISLALLVLGLAALCLSFFGYRILQVINFAVSFAGFALSVAFGVLLTVFSVQIAESELSEIMSISLNFLIWLPAVFFLIGSVFTYAYAKMPGYSLAEGRFFTTLGAALNPRGFLKTFRSDDDTENLFRSRVPLKKKKYATLGEPKAIRNSKKAAKRQLSKAKKKNKKDGKSEPAQPVQDKRLTPLQIALAKREHAEKVANVRADEENRALFAKPKDAASEKADKPAEAGRKPHKRNRSSLEKTKSLELAKRRAEHAEMVASRNDEIF